MNAHTLNLEAAKVTTKIPSIYYNPNIDWGALKSANEPVIIRGLISHWPALTDPARCWSNVSLLKKRIVEDTVVPIEVGSSYMDAYLQKPLVGLGSFLDYIMQDKEVVEGGPRIYLAQHELHNIPVMRDDVETPTMCTTTGKGTLYRTNVWFNGAKGTASPCHFDPFENLLCQVVGKKEVTLFAPALGHSNLYPAVGTVQANTSLVDMENPDLSAHPLYYNAVDLVNNHNVADHKASIADTIVRESNDAIVQKKALLGGRGVLHAGDAVYIPYKWWHFCKTDNVSCSVNYWWL